MITRTLQKTTFSRIETVPNMARHWKIRQMHFPMYVSVKTAFV